MLEPLNLANLVDSIMQTPYSVTRNMEGEPSSIFGEYEMDDIPEVIEEIEIRVNP